MTPDERASEKPASSNDDGTTASVEEKRNTQRLGTTTDETKKTTQPLGTPDGATGDGDQPHPEDVAEPEEPFDPSKWGTLEITSSLRAKMLASERPRLDHKYFEDTVPPNAAKKTPTPVPPQEGRQPDAPRQDPVAADQLATATSKKPEALPKRRMASLVLAVFGFAVFVVVALSLLVSTRTEEPRRGEPTKGAAAQATPLPATTIAPKTATPVRTQPVPSARAPSPEASRTTPKPRVVHPVAASSARKSERTPAPLSVTRRPALPSAAAPLESSPVPSAKPRSNPDAITFPFDIDD